MKPLIVLITVFVVALTIFRFTKNEYAYAQAARVAMAAMLLFTALGHFLLAKGMAMMVPDFIPFKTEAVYASGIIEIAAAIGLLVPSLRVLTGALLIVFFVLMLPANIKAASQNINYQTGALDGAGLAYLWFRIPLQLLFIAWVYVSTLRG
jgi:uncharacterized membrane protein